MRKEEKLEREAIVRFKKIEEEEKEEKEEEANPVYHTLAHTIFIRIKWNNLSGHALS